MTNRKRNLTILAALLGLAMGLAWLVSFSTTGLIACKIFADVTIYLQSTFTKIASIFLFGLNP